METENGARHGEVVQFAKGLWLIQPEGAARTCLSIFPLSKEPA